MQETSCGSPQKQFFENIRVPQGMLTSSLSLPREHNGPCDHHDSGASSDAHALAYWCVFCRSEGPALERKLLGQIVRTARLQCTAYAQDTSILSVPFNTISQFPTL